MATLCSLEGKVVLITGAATGIGLACARLLAQQGAAVMLSDLDEAQCRRQIEKLYTDNQIPESAKMAACALDVTREDQWQAAIEQTLRRFDGLDVLVNNAGIYVGGTLVENALEDVQRVQQVNVDSIFLGMKYAARAMQPGGPAGKGGSIINLSSVAGLVGVPGHSAYGASKGAVRLYSKHAAVEFARLGYNIRVNSVHPGLIATAMGDQAFQDFVDIGLADTLEQARALVLQMTPMGRLGQPEDIASMVSFLASDASAYCTGAEFNVDGGMSAA
ncbi:glucose 1-dehydrogenase [Pseudomaricurvus alkylphenolicus]|uniref:SDR family NAD(P)-dependent oxidoreductase n=1 Tax=Pseudomaricurvus alkylphenolicus TaxID=1306991 RepID=UPI00142491DA|nr:glucose 1-dehydrogenase [Pseudomaricurvus alkylphenolicus]NIB41608.1 glucose 1-dehydrogenase [Pseudomaricurvus alkylphenolicus]